MGSRNSGPKPKSHALKVLRGVKRADRLNPNEPKPPSAPVTKPAGLTQASAAIWDELTPMLE